MEENIDHLVVSHVCSRSNHFIRLFVFMMVIKILRTNYKARYCSSKEKVEGASFCVFSYELKINFRKNCNMAFQESLWNVFQETE